VSCYADTSFLVALRAPHDTFHRAALDFYELRQDEVWIWSPWHRVEVFNTIRQLTRHPNARRAITAADARALIHRLEREVSLGYFTHFEADWRDVLRTANEISIASGFSLACRAPDLLHVAYAKDLAAEKFISFDDDQLALAAASGLKPLKPK
jgi:predicted nucleic acid-binding protein